MTQWLPTGFDGKVPPNFGPLRIVRFWKMRTFWKAYVLDNAGWSKFGTPPPWNSKFSPFLAISPPFQFPLFLAYLNLSDFYEWGIFGKLTTWTMRDTQILGPHPTGILNFPPFPPLFLFQFPLFLDYLNLSDFDKWGLFGKLTTWTMRDTQNLGPHPTRIHNFPPFPPLTPMIWSHIGHNVSYFAGITIMSSFHKCLW